MHIPKMNGLKIGVRMSAGYASVLMLVALMMAVGVWSLKSTTAAMRAMMNVPLQKERLVDEWYATVLVGVYRNASIVMTDDEDYAKRLASEAKDATVGFAKTYEQILALATSPEEKALFARVNERRSTYNAVKNNMIKAKEDGRSADARQIYRTSFVKESPAYLAQIREVIKFEHRELENVAVQVGADAARSVWLLSLICVAVIAAGAGFAWSITISITRPLARTVELADAVASGDLTRTVAFGGRDEIAALTNSLGRMSQRLQVVLAEVRQSSDSIQIASGEVAVGNQDLASRTEQAAGHLERTASSMEELAGTVRQTSVSAGHASRLAVSAAEVATRGGSVVQDVIAIMDKISASSSNVAEIIGTIDGIAFQTNILALNAAVEAARAGEQGRGFAVVAAEVRTLAQRSASAAREIKTLISSSVETVESGSHLVAVAGATMVEIVGSVQRVADIIGDITTATSEQSHGISEVSNAVSELDRMTQQNSALVEESAAAAESLKDQAGRLSKVLSGFKLQA